MSNTDKYVPPPMRKQTENKTTVVNNSSKSVPPPMRKQVENKTSIANNSSIDSHILVNKGYLKKKPKNTIPPESKWPILQTSYKPTFADVEAIYVNSKEVDSKMFHFGNYAQPPKYFKIPENLDPIVKLGHKLFINSNRISDLNDPEKDKMIRRPTYSTNANYLHYETEETYIFNSPVGKQVMDLLNSYYDDTSKGTNYSGLDPFQFVSSKPGIPIIDENDIINTIDKWKSFLDKIILLNDENIILLEECIKERNDILEKTDKTFIRDDEINKQYVLSLLEQADVDEIKKNIHKFFIQPLVDLYVKQRDTKFCQQVIDMYYPVNFLYEEDGLKYISKDIISYMRIDRKKAIPYEWAKKIINENSELSKKLLEELEKIPDEDLPELSDDFNYFLGKEGSIINQDSVETIDTKSQYKQIRIFTKREIYENYLRQMMKRCNEQSIEHFYHYFMKNDEQHSKKLLLEDILMPNKSKVTPTFVLGSMATVSQYLYNEKTIILPWIHETIDLGQITWNPLLNRAIVSCLLNNNTPTQNIFPIRLSMGQHWDTYKSNKYIKNFNELDFVGFFIIRYGYQYTNYEEYLKSLNLTFRERLYCMRKYDEKRKRYFPPSNLHVQSFDVILLFKFKSNISDISEYKIPYIFLTDMTSRYIDMGDTMHHESYTYMEWNQLQYSLYQKENSSSMWVILKMKTTNEIITKSDPIINTFCKSEFDKKNNIKFDNRRMPEDCIESWFSAEALEIILNNNLYTFSCKEMDRDSIHFLFSKLKNTQEVYDELLKINDSNHNRISIVNLNGIKNSVLKIISDVEETFYLIQVSPEWNDGLEGGTKLEINFGSIDEIKLKYNEKKLTNMINDQVKDTRCFFERDTKADINNRIFMTHGAIEQDFITKYKNKITNKNLLLGGENKYKYYKYDRLIKKINRMNYLMKLIYEDKKNLLNKDLKIYPQLDGIENRNRI